MDKKEKLPRVNIEVPKDLYAELRAATVGQPNGVKITGFVCDAIAEKLGRTSVNPDIEALTHLYGKLNDEGKSWLMKCAAIAAESDSTRVIKPRKDKIAG